MSQSNKKTIQFDVEISSLMSTIINSVYTNKDISIRELVSNSSDALDKLLTTYNNEEYRESAKEGVNDLRINLEVDSESKTLTITDNGIGMNHSDLKDFLGKIANSGTKQFKELMKDDYSAQEKVNSFIGQFGLGFYSSFLISDRVDVVSRKVNSDTFKWSSEGINEYSLEECSESEMPFKHGTKVTLHIKNGCEAYLDSKKIKEIINRHSQFLTYPIYLLEESKPEKENKEENKEEADKVEEVKEDDKEVKEDDKVEEVKEEPKFEFVKVNTEKPLWTINPKDISKEEYVSFYKSISNDWDEYAHLRHKTFEGITTFTILLFVPKKNTSALMGNKNKQRNIKLYCNNVFINDNFDDILPEWLSFVSGVVSSPDLPMNISREVLQGDKIYKTIKRMLIRETVKLLEELSHEDSYNTFYKEFSAPLKFAVKEDTSGQNEKLTDLLRFKTSKRDNVSFAQYKESMKEGEKNIYALTGLTMDSIENSPYLAYYIKNDIEVILMGEPMDEVMLQVLKEYKTLPIQRINGEGVEGDSITNEDFNKVSEDLKTLLAVEKVELKDLGDNPILLMTPKHGLNPAMIQILKAQPDAKNNPFLQMMNNGKHIVQINPTHSSIIKLNTLNNNGEKEEFDRLAKLLFNTALMECGFEIKDMRDYARSVYEQISK